MLTDQDRQRIESEERKRIAEEQYRAEVRGSLPGARSASSGRPLATILLTLLGCLLITAVVWWFAMGQKIVAGQHPQPRYAPVSLRVASGDIVVGARSFNTYPIQILPEMRHAHVAGRFTASGGSGNDIAAVLATEDEFQNWINDHQAKVFYSTQGQETTGHFDVPQAPGRYVLGFSNQFSSLTAKQVAVDATLNYDRLEH